MGTKKQQGEKKGRIMIEDDNDSSNPTGEPLAVSKPRSIEKTGNGKPISPRKSGGKKKNEPAKSAISEQVQKVDESFVNVDFKIDQIEGYLEYQAEQSSDRLAEVLNNAPDRFFQLVEEKVGAVEIDTTQFDRFNADIDQMLEGFRNARTAKTSRAQA
jgi:hypothetical protein